MYKMCYFYSGPDSKFGPSQMIVRAILGFFSPLKVEVHFKQAKPVLEHQGANAWLTVYLEWCKAPGDASLALKKIKTLLPSFFISFKDVSIE